MIALKTDPIWCRISVFGLPYPPFDEYGIMWIRDIDREECLRLGVIYESHKQTAVFRVWEEDRLRIRRLPNNLGH